MLARIAALLRQAEGTDNQHEAEAFMAAAQRLATATSIDLAVARAHSAERTKSQMPVQRTITIGKIASELFDRRARSAFAGDDERVFCHRETGGPLDHKRYAATLRLALKRAKVDDYVRPFHDGRHFRASRPARRQECRTRR